MVLFDSEVCIVTVAAVAIIVDRKSWSPDQLSVALGCVAILLMLLDPLPLRGAWLLQTGSHQV